MEATRVAERHSAIVRTRHDCRLCGSERLHRLWSFGETPLANNYVTPEHVASMGNQVAEVFAPLDVYQCDTCHLVQLRDVVDPTVLFGEYLYVSSTSPAFVQHFVSYADTLVKRFDLTNDDLVVDVGSNDGVLLKPLQQRGVRVLGVEPALAIAARATADGIETIAQFFTPAVARAIVTQHGPARLVTANNVFAHTDNVIEFVQAVHEVLQPNGVFVFEVQYLGDLMLKNLFDIVYHEHLCYYHIHPLVEFFARQGMQVFDVQRLPVHGGSLRVYVARQATDHAPIPQHPRLQRLLREEESAGLNTNTPYQAFAQRIAENKEKLQKLLHGLKASGKRIAGYGAPAKATTLCYVFGLNSLLDYIVDDSSLKQGRLMPGTHIPIVPATALTQDPVDVCLLLAWNFAEPIMAAHPAFTQRGGRWLIPVPEPRLL